MAILERLLRAAGVSVGAREGSARAAWVLLQKVATRALDYDLTLCPPRTFSVGHTAAPLLGVDPSVVLGPLAPRLILPG